MESISEPGCTEKNYWRDLWHYRELFYIPAWRDISVRYKQTAIGVLWALIQPRLTMLIMTIIFGRVRGQAERQPYVPLRFQIKPPKVTTA